MEVKIIRALSPWKVERMKELHARGLSVTAIRAELGIKRDRLLAAMKREGLEPNETERTPTPYRRQPENKLTGQAAPVGKDFNLAEMAEKELGSRLTYKRGVRLLDGSPCTLDEMMQAANRQRKAGIEEYIPLGKKPEWH